MLEKEAQIDIGVPLDVLFKLATKAASSIINKFERKINKRGAVKAGK